MITTAIPERLRSVLACPACHGALTDMPGGLRCDRCAAQYPVEQDVPVLLTGASRTEFRAKQGKQENVAMRRRLGRYPFLLRVVEMVRPPHPFLFTAGKSNRAQFSDLVMRTARGTAPVVFDVGSGVHGGRGVSGLHAAVLDATFSLEIAPAPGAHVVGDAHMLPITDDALDGLLIQGVLEHVRDPQEIVAEILRVLKPGAPVYAEVPFLQHYHLDPADYRRYTLDGLKQLFGSFTIVAAGVAAGPSSALCDILTEYLAVPFRSPVMYWGIKWITGWLLTPVRWLDVLMARAPRADHIAGGLYLLGVKPLADAR